VSFHSSQYIRLHEPSVSWTAVRVPVPQTRDYVQPTHARAKDLFMLWAGIVSRSTLLGALPWNVTPRPTPQDSSVGGDRCTTSRQGIYRIPAESYRVHEEKIKEKAEEWTLKQTGRENGNSHIRLDFQCCKTKTSNSRCLPSSRDMNWIPHIIPVRLLSSWWGKTVSELRPLIGPSYDIIVNTEYRGKRMHSEKCMSQCHGSSTNPVLTNMGLNLGLRGVRRRV
jgi:hypothetical protein